VRTSKKISEKTSEECGLGLNVTGDRFPWDVRLGYRDRKRGRLGWFCTGMLISSSWILSAAHCSQKKTVNAALLGGYQFEKRNRRTRRVFKDEENVQTLTIDQVINHPDFQNLKSRIIIHDIALYHLEYKAKEGMAQVAIFP